MKSGRKGSEIILKGEEYICIHKIKKSKQRKSSTAEKPVSLSPLPSLQNKKELFLRAISGPLS